MTKASAQNAAAASDSHLRELLELKKSQPSIIQQPFRSFLFGLLGAGIKLTA
jgi:hypothetical protein